MKPLRAWEEKFHTIALVKSIADREIRWLRRPDRGKRNGLNKPERGHRANGTFQRSWQFNHFLRNIPHWLFCK
jgi:hypothetical protein